MEERMNLLIKYVIVVIAVGLLSIWCFELLERIWSTSNTVGMQMILTVSALILAGGVSRYFSFSYGDADTRGKTIIGDFATGLMLLVVMTAVISACRCISLPAGCDIGWFLAVVVVLLYSSLLFYDIYDYTKRVNQRSWPLPALLNLRQSQSRFESYGSKVVPGWGV
jgi:hypothetical protein